MIVIYYGCLGYERHNSNTERDADGDCAGDNTFIKERVYLLAETDIRYSEDYRSRCLRLSRPVSHFIQEEEVYYGADDKCVPERAGQGITDARFKREMLLDVTAISGIG